MNRRNNNREEGNPAEVSASEDAQAVEVAENPPEHVEASSVTDPDNSADVPVSDFPPPQSLAETEPFLWDSDLPPVETYALLGRRLRQSGDLFRTSEYRGGLLMVCSSPQVPSTVITKGSQLAPVIMDRVRVTVFKNGKPSGTMVSTKHLNTMLGSEVFLQQFPPLDMAVTTPLYLPGFQLVQPGYNDGGRGHRVFYVGKPGEISGGQDTINRFLNVMAFATDSDRTNAVAAALTVILRNFWPGEKPLLAVTSTKSHGGKETVIAFAAGQTAMASVSWESADWALQKNFVESVKQNPDVGVVNIENVRPYGSNNFSSAFLERFLTDPNPILFSTGSGNAKRRRSNLVIATSTNYGTISQDLLNRALSIHLTPIGDVSSRETPIGNPKLEYLPSHRPQIAAELRGMIQAWDEAGRPLDDLAKHPFSDWARTIGGILQVSGYKGFLGNVGVRKTLDDPLRYSLGHLGAVRPNHWLSASEWVLVAGDLSLSKRIIPKADLDTPVGRSRGMGVVLSSHQDETFEVETENEIIRLKLEKKRGRFENSRVSTRYRFRDLGRREIPEDEDSPDPFPERSGQRSDSKGGHESQ